MKVYNKFVESKKEPHNKNDIWFDGECIHLYKEGEWKAFTVNVDAAATKEDLNKKQDTLVSGKNIKTINGKNIVGEGNVLIQSDWNAQKGEDGHIKNKPYEIFKSRIEKVDDNTLRVNVAEDEYNGDYSVSGHYMKWGYSLYKLQYDETNLEIGSDRDILYVTYDGGYYYLTHSRDDADQILSLFVDYPDSHSIFYTIQGIDAVCLTDEVVKTLPQNLSNDARNQVLENLGLEEVATKQYVDEAIRQRGTLVSDWNAREYEKGYIKNRTHYSELTPVYAVLTVDDDDNQIIVLPNVNEGEILTFNGVWYNNDIVISETKQNIGYDDAYFGNIYSRDDMRVIIEGELVNAFANGDCNFSDVYKKYVVKLDEEYIPETIARKSDLENIGGGKSKFQLYQENGGRFFTDENVYNIFDALRNECSDYYWDLEIYTPLESGNTYTFDELDLTYANFLGAIYDGRSATVHINDDDAITLYNPGEPTDSYLWFESDSAQLNIDLVAKTVEFNTWE